MLEMFDALRQMTPESVLFRLALAMLFGGMIGMEGPSRRLSHVYAGVPGVGADDAARPI